MKMIKTTAIAFALSAAFILPANMGAFNTQSENHNDQPETSACADIPEWVPKRSETTSEDGTTSKCNTYRVPSREYKVI
jgi:hypothetical protein